MNPRTVVLAAAVVLGSLLPTAVARAQGGADGATQLAAHDIGPSLAGTAIAFREPLAPRDATGTAFDGGALKNGPVLMIVGGAALIVGLIIGDTGGDILAVAGGVVGLYGLYVYLHAKGEAMDPDPSGTAFRSAVPEPREIGVGYRLTLPR